MGIDWKVKVDKSYEERNTMQMDRAVIEATRKTAELIEEQNGILRQILAVLQNSPTQKIPQKDPPGFQTTKLGM